MFGRYAFKDSIEAATCALHDKIKTGELAMRDGEFPTGAHDLFRQFGPSNSVFERVGSDEVSSLFGRRRQADKVEGQASQESPRLGLG